MERPLPHTPNHGIGHNRPPEPEYPQVIMEGMKRVSEHLEKIPAKWLHAITSNKELNDCCREVDNLSYERRKTRDKLRFADLVVFQCDCGRKHSRLMLGGPGEK